MAKVLIDFGKRYEEQTKEVKEKFCKHDFYEIKNLLNFKKRLKKVLTNKQMYGIIITEREVINMKMTQITYLKENIKENDVINNTPTVLMEPYLIIESNDLDMVYLSEQLILHYSILIILIMVVIKKISIVY